MEGLSDFALKSILEEIEERMKEAKTEQRNIIKDITKPFLSVSRLSKTEKTGDKKPNCQNSAVSFFIISLFDLTQAARL